MKDAGLEYIAVYITRIHNTFDQYISMRPIMELLLEAAAHPGVRVKKRWWENEGVGLA